jgi:hypothetical protein
MRFEITSTNRRRPKRIVTLEGSAYERSIIGHTVRQMNVGQTIRNRFRSAGIAAIKRID